MFKEQYIRDNEKLHAKETLLMEIKEKHARENTRFTRQQKFVRYGAIAAAFILVIGGVLGVWFANRGSDTTATTEQTLEASAADAAVSTVSIDSYDDIYDLIEQMGYGYDYGLRYGVTVTEEAATDDAVMEAPEAEVQAAADTATGSSGSTTDYSETNVQVKGVDEADIVKTDGEYIYYVADNQLNIIKADGADTKLVSTTLFESDDSWWGYNTEMFLLDDRLMVISQGYSTVWVYDSDGDYESGTDQTKAIIYDVSNPAKPEKIVSLGQSGDYVSARMIGDYVYLVTAQYVYNAVRSTPVTYIPSVSVDEESTLLSTSDLYVYGTPQSSAYTVIGAINLKNGVKHASAKAVFGGASDLYANAEHMLLAIDEYDSDTSPIAPDEDGKNVQITTGQSNTELILLSLNEGEITKLASGAVPGSLLNQFSMDEYNGAFRIVTTIDWWEQRVYTDGLDSYEYDSKNYNNLYTLDLDLNIIGKIENLAEDESVQSVRFDGDVGYFVTFRQVDPLFAVDLSDPTAPKVLSTLKIPGFSEYLQTFGDGLLFGIGYDADEDTGRTLGVKLTMFDTSDKTDVTELFTEPVDADWTIIGSNHHAILVDADKNLIAFPADNDYYIYRYYAGTGFELAAKVDLSSDLSSWNLRGLFIGNDFYVLSESSVTVISLTDFGVLTTLKIG